VAPNAPGDASDLEEAVAKAFERAFTNSEMFVSSEGNARIAIRLGDITFRAARSG
jgi:hypothetical protein